MSASPETPVYSKTREDNEGVPSSFFMIVIDEGWRSMIMCTGMYEWAADWLIDQLQGRPFAPDHERGRHARRPG